MATLLQVLRILRNVALGGYSLDSGNGSGGGVVGWSPWTARDALVPLPQVKPVPSPAGAS